MTLRIVHSQVLPSAPSLECEPADSFAFLAACIAFNVDPGFGTTTDHMSFYALRSKVLDDVRGIEQPVPADPDPCRDGSTSLSLLLLQRYVTQGYLEGPSYRRTAWRSEFVLGLARRTTPVRAWCVTAVGSSLLYLGAAAALWSGAASFIRWAVPMLLLALVVDAADGVIARDGIRRARWVIGDYLLDLAADGVFLLAAGVAAMRTGDRGLVVLVAAAGFASFTLTYIRAIADILDVDPARLRLGLRSHRWFIVIAGLLPFAGFGPALGGTMTTTPLLVAFGALTAVTVAALLVDGVMLMRAIDRIERPTRRLEPHPLTSVPGATSPT